ncbi:MAG: response regulator transcription factor [Oscillibacter sp.]|nr:response regulator transcription factor [Oscillibacter sp.]
MGIARLSKICYACRISGVMTVLEFAICDDEAFMAEELASQLTGYMGERTHIPYHVTSFSSGQDLLESGSHFDLIFLDIQMDRLDGMKTARQLRRQGEQCLLIFVTVLKECVFDSFAVEAFDYLIKPLDSGRFRKTMDRAMKSLDRRDIQSIQIQHGSSWERIPLADIVYCEVLGRKLYIHRQGGTVTVCYGKLDEWEKRVDGRFFRCHRSYLVNLDCVRGCGEGRVTLSPEGSIPVSRLRERDFMQALLRRMKECDL